MPAVGLDFLILNKLFSKLKILQFIDFKHSHHQKYLTRKNVPLSLWPIKIPFRGARVAQSAK